jgi:hypothetical protein
MVQQILIGGIQGKVEREVKGWRQSTMHRGFMAIDVERVEGMKTLGHRNCR